MVKKTAWVLLKNYFILSLVSALLIKFSGGNGFVIFAPKATCARRFSDTLSQN